MKIPTNASFPLSLFVFERNLSDVKLLLELARKGATATLRTREARDVVNRSALVLVCASWEAFLEDLASDALTFLVKHRHPADDLSPAVRAIALRTASRLGGDNHPALPLVAIHKERDKFLGLFSTPKAANVDSLFLRTLGLPQLSSCWLWRRTSAVTARRRLDHYVTLRGGIAHRTKGPSRVSKREVLDFMLLCERISWRSCDAVRDWLAHNTGKDPWHALPSFGSSY